MNPALAESLPGPRLPLELERLIFEVAALSRPIGIPTLMLVAWRIKNWVEPLLYRVLCIGDNIDACKKYGFPVITPEVLCRAFDSRLPTLFARGVESLLVNCHPGRLSSATLSAILSACPAITTLCTYYSSPVKGSLEAMASLRTLRRLSLNVWGLFSPADVDFAHPLFQNITHLELFEDWDDELAAEVDFSLYTAIIDLPSLSHIAFNNTSLCNAMEPLFLTHARLRCFVCLSFRGYMSETRLASLLPGPHRPEFVHISQTEVVGDWIRGVQTGEDYWALAEEFIAAKRAGKVDLSRYMISDDDPFWRI
ncbi:hypothetical protein C8R46DRAFT_1262592 [Mycena filopes]|nr:hypothetical protein C8R46DRAFT_1262592 [Mycena filopes]